LPDRFNNAFQIRHHLSIGESHYLETLRGKEGVAILVGLLPFFEVMRLAVEFDDELDREASKIGDVVSKRDLSAKAEAVNSISLEVTPQQSFGTCHRLAKLFRPAALVLAHYCVRHPRLPPSLTLPHKGGGNGKSVQHLSG